MSGSNLQENADIKALQEEKIYASLKRSLLAVIPDLDSESISMDQSLSDLGCNSIDRADIVTTTMEELGVTVPVMEFREAYNIRTLINVLRKHL